MTLHAMIACNVHDTCCGLFIFSGQATAKFRPSYLVSIEYGREAPISDLESSDSVYFLFICLSVCLGSLLLLQFSTEVYRAFAKTLL